MMERDRLMGVTRQLVRRMFRGGAVLVLVCGSAVTWGQKPILPICSDDPKQKLPACKAGEAPVIVAPGSPSTVTPDTPFPFPGDSNGPATAPTSPPDKFPFPGETPAPSAATPPAPTPTSGQFPFPGEPAPVKNPNEKISHPDGEPDSNAADSSSSSSSSSSDKESVPRFKDEGSEGSTRSQRRRLPKVEDMGAREEEDIRVAKFYYSTGNFMGAYMRAKDAIKIDPEDPEAYYALAINAEKLAKKDEAKEGYVTYLRLEPDGHDAKAAKQALTDLR